MDSEFSKEEMAAAIATELQYVRGEYEWRRELHNNTYCAQPRCDLEWEEFEREVDELIAMEKAITQLEEEMKFYQ